MKHLFQIVFSKLKPLMKIMWTAILYIWRNNIYPFATILFGILKQIIIFVRRVDSKLDTLIEQKMSTIEKKIWSSKIYLKLVTLLNESYPVTRWRNFETLYKQQIEDRRRLQIREIEIDYEAKSNYYDPAQGNDLSILEWKKDAKYVLGLDYSAATARAVTGWMVRVIPTVAILVSLTTVVFHALNVFVLGIHVPVADLVFHVQMTIFYYTIYYAISTCLRPVLWLTKVRVMAGVLSLTTANFFLLPFLGGLIGDYIIFF
jgi:hypothetical protein